MIQAVRFTLAEISNEARHFVERGRVARHQPLVMLAPFYSAAEWSGITQELICHDFCLHDPVCDLVAQEDWPND
ncbi:DUF4327 family protein [Candidatus Cyanaurora vandensis]|uniref:DUF4327 family protein n=1 Tax=Candidatus Cyanaurora vandensis TaxID=2714958 RepID=UPI00257ADFDB|nr:DUF4327 family protein [Candidatus Cyanaurora vandensis]